MKYTYTKNILILALIFSFVTNCRAQYYTYSQNFTAGTSVPQCNAWNTYLAGLNPGMYRSVRMYGTFDMVGYTCTDPIIVNAIATALKNSTTYYSPSTNGHIWNICTIANYPGWYLSPAVFIDPGSSCPGGDCFTNVNDYVIRPCLGGGTGSGVWGGVRSGSCAGTPQLMALEFWYGLPCDKIPTITISGPAEACFNRSFKVSLDSFYADANYTWEYSDDGSTWSPFIGNVDPKSAVLTDSITSTRWYRLTVSCINNSFSYTTKAHKVDVAAFYYCYCNTSKGTVEKGLDVGNVKMTSQVTGNIKLDNGIGTPLLLNDSSIKSYSDFQRKVPPVVLYRDTSYIVRITQINATNTAIAGIASVFIDYNRDGQFDTVKERVMNKAITNPSGVESDTFAVPFDAGIGLTGLRVVLRTSGDSEPCTGYSNGETEDYLVDLRYEPCKGAVYAGIIEGDSSLCTGYDYVVYDTTYDRRKSEVGRMWQVSGDNMTWQNAPSGGNKDSLMRIFTSQPLYYRLRTNCIPTLDTTYSPSHFVNAKAAYKCYCFSQAVGGYYKDSSDIGGISIGDYVTTDGGAHLKNPRATRKYQDHTDDAPVDINVDSMYSLTVFHTMKNDFHGDAKITIFMDFNNNHQYDIPEERVFTGYTDVNHHTVVSAINIPKTTIMNVPTGMRVILNNNVGPNLPSDEACGTYASGETENYMIKFVQGFPASVNGHSGITNLSVYPNPTSGKFRLEYSGTRNVEEVEISVQDVTGRKLRSYREHNGGSQFGMDIDLSNEAKGVYFVEVKAGAERRIERITVK